jgi:hypothetical protein
LVLFSLIPKKCSQPGWKVWIEEAGMHAVNEKLPIQKSSEGFCTPALMTDVCLGDATVALKNPKCLVTRLFLLPINLFQGIELLLRKLAEILLR